MKTIIDVNGHRNSNKLTGNIDVDGVILRASVGYYKDKSLDWFVSAMRDRIIGAYHYLYFRLDPDKQLEIFAEQVDKLQKTLGHKVLVVVDVEDLEGANIIGKLKAIDILYTFASKLKERYKEQVMIYTASWCWNPIFNVINRKKKKKEFEFLTSLPLWVANYWKSAPMSAGEYENALTAVETGKWNPRLPVGWKDYDLWQIGIVGDGYILDRDIVDVNVLKNEHLLEIVKDSVSSEQQGEQDEYCRCSEILEHLKRIEKHLGIE